VASVNHILRPNSSLVSWVFQFPQAANYLHNFAVCGVQVFASPSPHICNDLRWFVVSLADTERERANCQHLLLAAAIRATCTFIASLCTQPAGTPLMDAVGRSFAI